MRNAKKVQATWFPGNKNSEIDSKIWFDVAVAKEKKNEKIIKLLIKWLK